MCTHVRGTRNPASPSSDAYARVYLLRFLLFSASFSLLPFAVVSDREVQALSAIPVQQRDEHSRFFSRENDRAMRRVTREIHVEPLLPTAVYIYAYILYIRAIQESEQTITMSKFRQGRVERVPRTPIQRALFYWTFLFYRRALPTRHCLPSASPGTPCHTSLSPMHISRASPSAALVLPFLHTR